MKNGNKILFAAQDPGGFNSLVSIIKTLKGGRFDVDVFLANESCLIAKKNKIKFLDCSAFPEEKLKEVFQKINPQIVVTATSFGLSLDKKIIRLAKEKKIPVISLIDFWANYKIRFSNPEKEDLVFLPDLICVVDEYMKKEMIKEGFDRKILQVTGNPFFDGFKKISKAQGAYFLFISQPFTELGIPGFDEVKIFQDFINVLSMMKNNIPVVISFHPREKNKKKYEKIISGANIKIKISKKSGGDLIDNAWMVLGINSMALFLAAIKGKKVVSYQPGVNKEKDVLISNWMGLSTAVYDFNKLGEAINNVLKNKKGAEKFKKIRKKYVKNNSTRKVIKIIKNII